MERETRNIVDALPQQIVVKVDKKTEEKSDCAQSCGNCSSCACGDNSCGSCSICASCGCDGVKSN